MPRREQWLKKSCLQLGQWLSLAVRRRSYGGDKELGPIRQRFSPELVFPDIMNIKNDRNYDFKRNIHSNFASKSCNYSFDAEGVIRNLPFISYKGMKKIFRTPKTLA